MLVFLPGYTEIYECLKALQRSPSLKGTQMVTLTLTLTLPSLKGTQMVTPTLTLTLPSLKGTQMVTLTPTLTLPSLKGTQMVLLPLHPLQDASEQHALTLTLTLTRCCYRSTRCRTPPSSTRCYSDHPLAHARS